MWKNSIEKPPHCNGKVKIVEMWVTDDPPAFIYVPISYFMGVIAPNNA